MNFSSLLWVLGFMKDESKSIWKLLDHLGIRNSLFLFARKCFYSAIFFFKKHQFPFLPQSRIKNKIFSRWYLVVSKLITNCKIVMVLWLYSVAELIICCCCHFSEHCLRNNLWIWYSDLMALIIVNLASTVLPWEKFVNFIFQYPKVKRV